MTDAHWVILSWTILSAIVALVLVAVDSHRHDRPDDELLSYVEQGTTPWERDRRLRFMRENWPGQANPIPENITDRLESKPPRFPHGSNQLTNFLGTFVAVWFFGTWICSAPLLLLNLGFRGVGLPHLFEGAPDGLYVYPTLVTIVLVFFLGRRSGRF